MKHATSEGLRALLVRNTAAQVASQGVVLLTNLVMSIVLSRYLGTRGFGEFSYIYAFYYFFLTVNDFGINMIVVREIAKDRSRARAILTAVLPFKAILALVSAVAAWVAVALMGFQDPLRQALWLFSLILPLTALQLPAIMLRVTQQLQYPAFAGATSRLVSLALVLLAVNSEASLVGITAALLAGETLYLVLLWTRGRDLTPLGWRVDWPLWRAMLRSAGPVGFTGLATAVINRIDFIMLERMTDLEQVGLYAAAYRVTNMLEGLPLMMMATLFPAYCAAAEDRSGRLADLYNKSVRLFGFIALPVGLLVTLLAPVIVRVLFGAAFEPAARALVILGWATVCVYLAIPGGQLLVAVGRERANFLVNASAAAVNVVLNIILIPKAGLTGAAAATLAAYLFRLAAVSLAAHQALLPAQGGLKTQDSRLKARARSSCPSPEP